KSAQIREILINESAWEEMTCLFALSLGLFLLSVILARNPGVPSDAVLTCMRLNANAQLQK
ncbi:hypothetical protein ACKUDX_27730, partial [Klebsiella pneumoniae]